MKTQAAKPLNKTFVTSQLPWILGGVMFVVYLATMYRWITPNPANLGMLVDLADWSNGGHKMGPLAFLATYPLRWLPLNQMPLALNLLTAMCAGLTLVLLARSVALLPHDRTYDQRQREQSEYSVLTISSAWAPPLLAVLLCGLQMTFWENAIQATGEMLDLLIFAYVVRCLLEYRISEKESWMGKFALVYGLGMANNWAMIGFFPAFLVAAVWIKGLSFFNRRFLVRTALLGLAGFLLFFLYPVMNSFSHTVPSSAWEMIRGSLSADKSIFGFILRNREIALLLCLTSVLPIFVMGIRWASYFGDNSALGIFMATSIFHIVHGLFLVACIWVAWDAPVSPRNKGFGFAYLPLYYLGAISIGYCTGYFLLVFGRRTPRYKHSVNPLLKLLNISVTTVIWVLVIVAPLVAIRKNWPVLQKAKVVNRAYEQYFTLIEKSLPTQPAVVLSDDSARAWYFQAVAMRDAKAWPHLLIDTSVLDKDPSYPGYLKSKNPGYQLPELPPRKAGEKANAYATVRFLEQLGASHDLYYINPSFGYFFERFYQEAHGPVYRLKTYETNVWDAPLPTQEQITENQNFWNQTADEELETLKGLINVSEFPAHPGIWEKFMGWAHLKAEQERTAFPLGSYYARALNFWGVQLARANELKEAGKCYALAVDVSPFNISARVNLAFNTNTLAGTPRIIELPKEMQERLTQSSGWDQILNVDGPVDEPKMQDRLAMIMEQAGDYRQAVQQLNRAQELSPDNPLIYAQKAAMFEQIATHPNVISIFLPDSTLCYNEVIVNADQAMKTRPDEPTMLFLKSVALIQLKEYARAVPTLNSLLAQQTNNYAAVLNRAISYYKTDNLDAAKADYEVVQKVAPKAFQVYYGLAEIAYRQKDFPTAIKNYEFYLTNAPPESQEASNVIVRLKELKNGER